LLGVKVNIMALPETKEPTMPDMNKQYKRYILKNLVLEGYKSISKQEISFEDVTIIIGANGSGKSNLLSFFRMLNNIMTGALQQYIGKEGGAQSLLYYGAKKTPVLSANLEFNNHEHRDTYSFKLVKAVKDSLIFSEELLYHDGKEQELESGQKESLLINELSSKPILKKVLSSCRFFQFHDTSENSNIRTNSRIDNNKYLYSDGGNLASYLYMLKNKPDEYRRYYTRIVEYIRYIEPQFGDFSLEPNELNADYISLNWKEKGEGQYLFGVHQISDGSLRFMALAALLLQPPEKLPDVIIIDEPELGLHPLAIDLLGSMIDNASKNAQVIVATQSPRLIDSFSARNILVAEHDLNNKCSIFKSLDTDTLAAWLEEYNLSQLWEKNILGGQP
jgi:predicted ATPase